MDGPTSKNELPKAIVTVRRTILFVSNCAWNLANFRRPIIEALVAKGDRVICAGAADGHEATLRNLGAEFAPLPVDAAGTSPIADARLLLDLVALLRREQPDIVLTFTIKPNIYGSLAARLCGVPAIATVSGLGSSFLGGGLVGKITVRLYRIALSRVKAVFFQNKDDRELFVSRAIVPAEATRLVAGSGLDLNRFVPPAGNQEGPFRFLLIARLLKDKGLLEYAEAARLLRAEGSSARFQVVGPSGGDNPSAVPLSDVERWTGDGTIDYLGSTDDVRGPIAAADCVVLPSYREGLPRSLLEGAAMARPLIATDVPGCRDVVSDGVNGILCSVRSAGDLARAMRAMVALNSDQRQAMGKAGRHLVEERYDQKLVVAPYLREVER